MSITPTEKTQEILSQAKDLAMEMKNTQVCRAWVGGRETREGDEGWKEVDAAWKEGRQTCCDARGTYGTRGVQSRDGPEAVKVEDLQQG